MHLFLHVCHVPCLLVGRPAAFNQLLVHALCMCHQFPFTVKLRAVAATDMKDNLAYFSNYGPKDVHIAAPGVQIWSTVPWDDAATSYMQGTSMAAPIVAGAAALLFAARPTATVAEVR